MKNNNDEEIQNYIKTDNGVLNFVIEGCGGNNDYYNITAYINGVDCSTIAFLFKAILYCFINSL